MDFYAFEGHKANHALLPVCHPTREQAEEVNQGNDQSTFSHPEELHMSPLLETTIQGLLAGRYY